MNSKADKNTSRKKEEKKPVEIKKFAQLSVDSTNAAAESIGISDLNEEASKRLTDDASYRLREVIFKCAVQLRHSGRRQLTAKDVNSVLHHSDVQPCYGHPLKDSLKFHYVKEAHVFVPEDEEVNLVTTALRREVYQQKDRCYVKAKWVFPDKNGGKTEEGHKPQNGIQVLPHHLKYYQQICKALLSKSMALVDKAIKDLRSNPNISSVAPLIVNLIAAYISKYQSNGVRVYFLLQAIDALLENKSVTLRASDKSNTLVTSLLLLSLNPTLIKGKSTLDDLFLRKCASKTMVKVLKTWHSLEIVIFIEIYYNLTGALFNPQNSLLCHLGALCAMNSFGNEAFDECFWPNLNEYFSILDKAGKSNVVHDIKGEILTATERLFIKNIKSPNIRQSIVFKCDVELQTKLREYFGDSLCARYRWCGTPGNILSRTTERKPESRMAGSTNQSKSLWTRTRQFKSLRCLPFSGPNRGRETISDVFEKVTPCDSILNQLYSAKKLKNYSDRFVKRFRFPPTMFQFHNNYSKSRFIGKLGNKRFFSSPRNISGNILVSL